MKKLLLSILIITFFLSACGQYIPHTSSIPNANPSDNLSSFIAESPNIEMVTSPNGAFQITIAKNGAYELTQSLSGGMVVNYIDRETCIRTPLCSSPECQHIDKTCSAWFSQASGSIFMNASKSRLFCITHYDIVDETPDTLWELSLDGRDRVKVYELPSSEYFIDSIASNDEQIFIGARYISEDGTESGKKLYAINPDEKNAVELITYSDSSWLYGAYGHSIVILSFTNDYSHVAFTYFVYDLDSGTKKEVYSGKYEADGRRPVTMTDQEYIYSIVPTSENHGKVISINMKNMEQKTICQDLPFFSSETASIPYVFDNKLIADIVDANQDTREISRYRYIVDCQNGQVTASTITVQNGGLQEFLTIWGSISETEFLVTSQYANEDIVIKLDNEQSTKVQVLTPQYSFMTKANFWKDKKEFIPITKNL